MDVQDSRGGPCGWSGRSSGGQDLQRLRGLVTASEPRTVFMLKEMDAPALKQVFLWTQDLAGGGSRDCRPGAAWGSRLRRVTCALGPAFLICKSRGGALSGD